MLIMVACREPELLAAARRGGPSYPVRSEVMQTLAQPLLNWSVVLFSLTAHTICVQDWWMTVIIKYTQNSKNDNKNEMK